jgi:hypothetical protein
LIRTSMEFSLTDILSYFKRSSTFPTTFFRHENNLPIKQYGNVIYKN